MSRNCAPACRGLVARDTQNIVLRGFTGLRRFINVRGTLRQFAIVEARLGEEFPSARTAGSEIKAVIRHHCSALRTQGLAKEAQAGSMLTRDSSILFTMERMPCQQ